MESFIAAHLGERGEAEEETRGGRGIRRQQIHSSILAFPPVHNNLRIYSIALLSFIITTESHPTDSAHIRKPHKATHACVHLQTHPHSHPALFLFFFLSRPDPLYVFDGPIHVVCDVADSPPPMLPCF